MDAPRPADEPPLDAAALARFRIDAPLEIREWLGRLRDAGTMLSLHPEPAGEPLQARIVAVNAPIDCVGLEPMACADGTALQSLSRANLLAAVAFVDAVRLQFELAGATLGRERERTLLLAPLPERLYRLQRRDAYRVQPIPRLPARCRLPDGAETRVIDVAVGGVSLAWPVTVRALPPAGTLIEDCTIELAGMGPFRCDLRVRFSSFSRLGCAFVALSPVVEREVQCYVNEVQRRLAAARRASTT